MQVSTLARGFYPAAPARDPILPQRLRFVHLRGESGMQGGLQFALAAVFVTTSACAHRRGSATDPEQLRPHAAGVSVNGTTSSQSAMESFVVRNESSYHMGTVGSGVPRRVES